MEEQRQGREAKAGRPDGEVGGHTVQPSEQKEPASLGEPQNPTSKDVPVPEDGAPEATMGAGMESAEDGDAGGDEGTSGSPGSSAMKPTGQAVGPHSRTQATQAGAASNEAAESVEEREGVAASLPPDDEPDFEPFDRE